MERPEHEPVPVGREPQVSDVLAAVRHLMAELAPDADPEDVAYAAEIIEAAADFEDAMGMAAGMFNMLGIDYDEGSSRLGEILQVEAILPGGDESENPPK